MGKLEDLMVDEDEIVEELLFELLSKYIKVGKRSKDIIFNPEFVDLKVGDKIIVYLLGRKALKMLNAIDDDKTGLRDICGATGIKYDSIKPIISGLARKNILEREDGNYFVPNYNLQIIKERLK